MSARDVWRAIVVGLVLLLGVAVPAMWPTDPAAYRDTAVKAAEAGLGAVRTVALLVQADRDGQVFPPYTRVVLADAREAVATAQRELATTPVPAAASARLRDELAPLLAEAAAVMGDAGTVLAGGDLTPVATRLAQVAQRLDEFAAAHR